MAYKLPKPVVKAIENKVDEIFDRVKYRFLGPTALPKRLYIGYTHTLSLPGVYESAAAEEGGHPDKDTLEQLIATAGNYIDSLRHRYKAKIVHSVQSFMGAVGGPKADPKDLTQRLQVELLDTFKDLKYEVHRVLDTETQKARNIGQLEGINRVNASLGIDDPTVFFVVVRDEHLCNECKKLHMLEDGKTPRVWKLSELGHGHHKRGESNPKIEGLHPHCRCTLTTLMPGFGFNSGGFVTWKSDGYDEYKKQREEELSKGESSKAYVPVPKLKPLDQHPQPLKLDIPRLSKDNGGHPGYHESPEHINGDYTDETVNQIRVRDFHHPQNLDLLTKLSHHIGDVVGKGVGKKIEYIKGDKALEGLAGRYDNKGISLHPKTTANLGYFLSSAYGLEGDEKGNNALVTFVHEAMHAAGNKQAFFNYEGAHLGEAKGSHTAIEEATTEILAHYYFEQAAAFCGKNVKSTKVSNPWFFRKTHQNPEETGHHGYEMLLRYPMSYPTYCVQFARLATYAENVRDSGEGDINEKLNNTIAHHAIAVKNKNTFERMTYLSARIAQRWGAVHPKDGGTQDFWSFTNALEHFLFKGPNCFILNGKLTSEHLNDACRIIAERYHSNRRNKWALKLHDDLDKIKGSV